jgi:hypothetical protein
MTKVNLGSLKVDALSQEEVITQIKSKLLRSAEHWLQKMHQS